METDLEATNSNVYFMLYRRVHHVCLHNNDQAASIPVCRACASDPDPD